jgi:hypothetical protein
MSYRRILALLALTVTALALTATSASATITEVTATGLTNPTGTPYNGSISGTENGTPTLVSGGNTVSCTSADVSGPVNGSNSTATLTFSWGGCRVAPVGGGATVSCTVDPISNVPTFATATGGGNGSLANTASANTTVSCGAVFNCNASSTVGGTSTQPVTADLNASANTATIADTVGVTGLVGCGTSGSWNAVYTVTPTNLEVR